MRPFKMLMKIITGIEPTTAKQDEEARLAAIEKSTNTRRMIGEANSLTSQLNTAIADLRSFTSEHEK